MCATLRNYIVEQAWVQPCVTILVEQALVQPNGTILVEQAWV